MARPRKPTAHLELVGAFKKNPQRERDSEPVCEDPPEEPDTLTPEGKRAWDFLVRTAVPGVLTAMDSAYLGMTANALGAVWYGDKEATITDMYKVGNMLGKLGMTPSDRSKVVVPKKKEGSRFSQFKKD